MLNFVYNRKALLLVIVLVGIVLRLWGLGFGLPYQFHQDEPIVVNHAMAYGTGDLNPHFFAIPPLTSYLLFLIYGALFFVGKVIGLWPGAEEFAVSFFKDPTIFYLVGRLFIGLVPGVLSILLIYNFAKRFLSKNAALYTSAIMSVVFINVINAHYIYTDMLLVMFMILVYDSIYSVFKLPKMKNYLIFGIYLGLAIGVKYNGIFLAAPFLLTHFIVSKRRDENPDGTVFFRKILAAAMASIIIFILVNPFSLIDFQGFLRSISVQSNSFWHMGWGYHIFYSLFEGISIPLTLFGILGLLLFVVREKEWGSVLIAFPVIFYIVLVNKSQPFSRYVLPLVPFLSIGTAYLLFEVVHKSLKTRRTQSICIGLSLLMLVPTMVKSIKADILFSSEDTRVLSAEWIKNNVPVGAKIACDSTNFRPVIKQPYSQLLEKSIYMEDQEGLGEVKGKKVEFMKRVSDKADKGYPLYFLSEYPKKNGQFLGAMPAIAYNINALKQEGIDYVVINNQIENEKKNEFLDQLKVKATMIKEFSPRIDGEYQNNGDLKATTCIPVKNGELFAREKMGPGLRIYRIK